jgi:hypothetical protein
MAMWWHQAVESALGLLSNEEFDLGFWEQYLPVWTDSESGRGEIRKRLAGSIDKHVSQHGDNDPVGRLWIAALERI